MLAELTADHQGHQLLAVIAGNRLDTHQLAVAQHGDALGHPCKLFKPMGYVDDRDATCLQPCDLLEKHFHFARGEHGSGFVENQHVTVADQVACDLDHLLMADPQFADQRVGIDGVQTHLSHGLDRVFAQALAVDPASPAGQVVKKQVFGHGQGRQQVEFLHDHANAELFGLGTTCRLIRLALEFHVSGGRRYQPADDFRQGAFTGTVFPGQRQHFAAHQRQVDVTEYGLCVGFADATDRKNSCLSRR